MSDLVNRDGMPWPRYPNAPCFTGDPFVVLTHLQHVDRLGQMNNLLGTQRIKELWQGLPEYRQGSFEDFTNEIMSMYPETGQNTYMRPAIQAPTVCAPQEPEHTLERPEITPIVPQCAPSIANPSLDLPEVPVIELAPPPAQVKAPIVSPQSKIRDPILIPISQEAPFDKIASLPAYIEAPIMRAPPEPIPKPEYPSAEVTPPQLKIHEPIIIPMLPEAPLEEILSPIVRDDSKYLLHIYASIPKLSIVLEAHLTPPVNQIRDDSKHLLPIHTPIHAPIPESPAVSEAHYATLSDQTYSDYCLPVKHPCIASPIHQVEYVSGDSEAPSECCIAPEVAQVAHLEALSHLPSSSHQFTIISSFMRCIRAPRTYIPALYATIIAEESSCYRIFTASSFSSCFSWTSYQSRLNLTPMRDLHARLAHIHTPIAFFITSDFAYFTLIRIFHSSTYYVDIVLINPIKGYPFMSWHQLALDKESIRRSRAIFALNFAYHSAHVNILTVYQPVLTLEDIVDNVPNHDCARSSSAHYPTLEHFHAPHIAPLGRAFNLYHKVQEFIPPVTSLPSRHI
ncbi:uncharacterized protein BJ212DRAFT_1487535 [Suillus subaureus]|uniref:Uncharacterized protein n=1 Tax=Suillus subaureus TaxID=48587 RepID=A0A9P7DSK1_9AGAM|nr:uncharacterized protein BJ212DRAFT_1487535 [Suillus subaureus]KAG1801884.1 hypothetical protein BJ212DRAFT_1487535 [Suillus subaureus]